LPACRQTSVNKEAKPAKIDSLIEKIGGVQLKNVEEILKH